ncbi:MAG TPA: response regulator transcription factor [Gemmatimonadaceae bacterium]|jgi:two-component system copper resistance phosphate regulon response regulator CusR|nr:response regulator transcription factor [Gemmatimonadaceae bacterium]
MRLLLVEDDPELSAILTDGLKEQGMDVAVAPTFGMGRTLAASNSYDLIILDVMLPGGSGFDLCRTIRDAGVGAPILILTAKDGVDDRVTGLDAGADDYLTKPFAFRELLARVRALNRRPHSLLPKKVVVADLEVDISARRASRAGKSIDLTAKEFSLLEFLATHKDVVVDRASITAHVWDENHDPFTNVLEVLVRRLRRKIDDGFEPKLIHTLRGAGYRLGLG